MSTKKPDHQHGRRHDADNPADYSAESKGDRAATKGEVVTFDRRYLDNPENPRRRVEDATVVTPKPFEAYPAYRYHETQGSRIVQNAEEDEALGAEWTDRPTDATGLGYPSWRYHLTKPPVLVTTKDEDDALGVGWFHTVREAAASTAS